MAWTQTELNALKRAYAAGVLSVSYDGQSVSYGSASDLLARIRVIESEMALNAGTSSRRTVASFRSGV